MSIRAGPEPKLAITTGAYTLASRAPNWLRRAGVATTRSDPSGSDAVGPSTSSLPAATPLACSAAHMAGSQATIALALTCPAIHREDVAVAPTIPAATAAETASTAQPTSASRRQPVIFRSATGCLLTHNRTVVAMTVGHDGSGRRAPACDHALLSAISAPNPATRQDA